MASKEVIPDFGTVIILTPTEVVEIVALLTAQGLNAPIRGVMHGASPEIRVVDKGVCVERILFCVDRTR